MNDFNWCGTLKRKFRFKTFRFEWGRWCFNTNALGETLRSKFIWEEK